MATILTLIVITLISLIAVRAGATALMMTGLSWDTACFQSYSAFFGVGFTTREAELVVNHPVRRRIIRDLILVGNIGLTSAFATLIATLVQHPNGVQPLIMIGVIIGGLFIVLYLTHFSWIEHAIDRVIQLSLRKVGFVHALDYELLLRVQHGYVILEVEVNEENSIANKSLRQSRPWDSDIVVLAISRDGEKIHGIPNAGTIIKPGDAITVYGKETSIKEVFQHAIKSQI